MRLHFYPLGLTLLAAATIAMTACGGGGSESDAGSTRVVTLEVESADDAVIEAASREHGAPGDNEAVVYHVRSSEPALARRAVLALRDNGFTTADAE